MTSDNRGNVQRARGSMLGPTLLMLCGLAVTAAILPSDGAEEVFRKAAVGVGIVLSVGTFAQASGGIRSLVRVDIVILWVLYTLTLFEFLFPQPDVDAAVSASAAAQGSYAVILAFAGIMIGRHLIGGRRPVRDGPAPLDVPATSIFVLFIAVALVGYLHILLSVNFNLVEALRQMALPRFEQSWARGKYGDVYSLLYELGMLIYLVPPIAGLIFARSREFSALQKVTVVSIFVLTLYYGFSSGTRSVLAVYIITWAGTYVLVKPGITWRKAISVAVPALATLFVAMIYMLEFRNIGLDRYSFQSGRQYGTVFIDNNIVNIARLTDLFPDAVPYLGLEIPFSALIRPIPRAIWPGKPEGLSTSIEEALGATQGMTLSCTFVGEAFMSGGVIAVIIFALIIGMAAELWNRVGRNVSSSFSQVLYGSGFLCAAISMRSILSMMPLVLPTLALWLYGRMWLARSPSNRRA